MSETWQLCTFTLDNLFCGLDVRRVQEVLRYREMTKVPLSPSSVQGLINLRGQIVIAIDLRRRLGLPPLSDGRLPMNIVTSGSEGTVSLLVDDIQDVLELPLDEIEPPPEPLDPKLKDLVKGVHKLDNKLLLALDVDKLLDIEVAADL